MERKAGFQQQQLLEAQTATQAERDRVVQRARQQLQEAQAEAAGSQRRLAAERLEAAEGHASALQELQQQLQAAQAQIAAC